MIALAAAADGERLVAECYGDTVGWLPWQRPGFELGLALRSLCSDRPHAPRGRHGRTRPHRVGRRRRRVRGQLHRAHRARRPFRRRPGPGCAARCDRPGSAPAARGAPPRRGVPVGADRARSRVHRRARRRPLLRRAGRARLPRARGGAAAVPRSGRRAPITSCAPRSVPCCSTPDPTCPSTRASSGCRARHAEYRSAYEAYYTAHATPDSPAMRGADPRIVLLPGIGMWSFGADPHTAQVAGEFFVNAINVMRGAEAVSTYTPIPDDEKFRVEYWELEERKLRAKPSPRPFDRAGGARHRRRVGRRARDRRAVRGRGCVRRDRRPRRRRRGEGRGCDRRRSCARGRLRREPTRTTSTPRSPRPRSVSAVSTSW